MKEYPIILTADEVLDILDRGKTQLRRPVAMSNSTVLGRRPRKRDAHEWFDGWEGLEWSTAYRDGSPVRLTGRQSGNFFGAGRNKGFSCGEYLHVPLVDDKRRYRVRCFWNPGDRLWVKEPWASFRELRPQERAQVEEAWNRFASGRDSIEIAASYLPVASGSERAIYKADFDGAEVDWKWKSPFLMRRWASRITLEVTAIRVRRYNRAWFWVIDFRRCE